MKRALIVGVTGQAGYYLTQLLASKGYRVYGTTQKSLGQYYVSGKSQVPTQINVQLDLSKEFKLGFASALREFKIDEVYNLASKMFAPASWEKPDEYIRVNGLAVIDMLAMIEKYRPTCKFFQAGSAEVFDRSHVIQNELTPRMATSPYGLSKIIAEEAVKMYRSKGLWACTGILFNMESPRRPKTFFAEKVAQVVVRAKEEFDKTGQKQVIPFGNLAAQRDWGLTEEYVEAMWLMLQAKEPRDYVIGTGQSNTCMSFLCETMKQVGLASSNVDLAVSLDWSTADIMHADPRKINVELGWVARSGFEEVVSNLVNAERGVTV